MSNHLARRLAAIPPGTLLAGIDLSLDSLVVEVLNAAGERLDHFCTDNAVAGYAYLHQRLKRSVAKHCATGIWVGMEPTNYYWKQVGYHLEQLAVPFRLVNALTVKRHREGDQLDRSKTDPRDAFTIADLLRTGKFTDTRLPHGVYAELQTGYIAYQRLRQDRGRQVGLLVNTVRQLFPEFQQVFKDVSGATALAVIEAGVLPAAIAAQSESEWLGRVRAQFHGKRLSVRPVQRLHPLAAVSHGLPEATQALSLMARQQAETIRLLDAHAAHLLQTLLALFHTLPEAPWLLSIQGLQAPSALGVVAHLGDLSQYHAGSALIKLAGTQPTPNTSGRKTFSATPFSHQGRSGLRTVVYFITLRLIQHNEALRHHYERLTTRAERPLPKMQAIGACMNKFLWYVWHVVKYRERYDAQYWRRVS